MSLDKLLIIFIIIILPIAFVLNVYVNAQADTLSMQSLYDSKLYNATNDALRAYQTNSFNESSSDLTALQMRNVEASANVFLNSLANNFSMQGFSKDTLQSHVPALVFTMYDGYYIYSKYSNTIDVTYPEGVTPTYKNGDLQWGVKPYIYYSCRYKRGMADDFVITYSLDNYIAIQGIIGGSWVNDSGYLIDTGPNNIKFIYDNKETSCRTYIQYRDIDIDREQVLKEYVGTKLYPYTKVNGIKYYYDAEHVSGGKSDPKWFSLRGSTKEYTPVKYNMQYDYSAYNYYKEAYEFTKRLINTYRLGDLRPGDAVDAYNASASDENGETFYEYNFYTNDPNAKIFELRSSDGISIEEPSSNFNAHRQAVIRYSIEKNLSIAIANYNTYSGGISTNFQMPILDETEWDKILSDITLISFMQGIPMGNKTYNGCAVIQNNKNGEVVAEDSIYIVNSNGVNPQGEGHTGSDLKYYYNVKKKNLETNEFKNSNIPLGILNSDLEKRYYYEEDDTSLNLSGDYYFPKLYYADYSSIVNQSENVNLSADTTDNKYKYALNGNIYKYLTKSANPKIAKAYYTALGRERYSTYKTTKMKKIPEDIRYNTEGNRNAYYIFSNLDYYYTWFEAEAYCESLGGHLVTITSQGEQEFLQNYIKDKFGSKEVRFWIGATDENNEGNWSWITGEPFSSYTNWASGNPNNWFEQDYAVIQNNGSYSWDDIDPYYKSGERQIYFICEWEQV